MIQDQDSTVVGAPATPLLEIVQGNEQGRIVRLKLRTRIGRERDNELVLTDPRVSRYHAVIELDSDRWVIRDQNSANGTFVNGRRVSVGKTLYPDDRIQIGDTEMIFHPSRVGVGGQVETATVLRLPEAIPMRARPRIGVPAWNWALIALGSLLSIALLLFVIFVATRGREQTWLIPGPTPAAVDLASSDFVLAYQDDFSDHDSGWDDAFDRYTVKQYGNNKYYIEVMTSNLVAWGLANRDVANFRLEVEATQESGPNNNGYGLLFRFQDPENYYRFDVSGEGYFLLSKFFRGEWTTLIPWTPSPILNVGQATNRLMVEALGTRIRVFANGVELGQVMDGSLSHGNFGVFANTFSEPNLVVSFDNIKLWVPRGESIAVVPTPMPIATLAVATPTNTIGAPIALSPPRVPTTEAVRPGITLALTTVGSPTPPPLPEYVSRNVPQARNLLPLQGRLFFPVFDAERQTYHIYAADPDGNRRERIVDDASQPDVNFDGQRIVFRSWRHDNRGLIERAVSGGPEWRFNTHFEAARPVFAPDGQMFLFHSREAGEPAAVYRTVGDRYEVLRREGAPIQGQSPAWVDGKRFVYQGCVGNACGLIISNLDGSSPQQITQDPGDTNPDVSPGGQQVVFMSRRKGNWDIYRVGIDGGDLIQLTTDEADDGLPVWSPDGKMIAFVSNRDGMWELWVMDADGDDQRPLFALGGSIDGIVAVDVRNSRGWLEEHIAWGP
ncbi:MAG: FHA domain-containing protein [Anaerolineae bacterium]